MLSPLDRASLWLDGLQVAHANPQYVSHPSATPEHSPHPWMIMFFRGGIIRMMQNPLVAVFCSPPGSLVPITLSHPCCCITACTQFCFKPVDTDTLIQLYFPRAFQDAAHRSAAGASSCRSVLPCPRRWVSQQLKNPSSF